MHGLLLLIAVQKAQNTCKKLMETKKNCKHSPLEIFRRNKFCRPNEVTTKFTEWEWIIFFCVEPGLPMTVWRLRDWLLQWWKTVLGNFSSLPGRMPSQRLPGRLAICLYLVCVYIYYVTGVVSYIMLSYWVYEILTVIQPPHIHSWPRCHQWKWLPLQVLWWMWSLWWPSKISSTPWALKMSSPATPSPVLVQGPTFAPAIFSTPASVELRSGEVICSMSVVECSLH